MTIGADTVAFGRPEELSVVPEPALGVKYAPSADGRRFLVITPVPQSQTVPLALIVNWSAGLAAD